MVDNPAGPGGGPAIETGQTLSHYRLVEKIGACGTGSEQCDDGTDNDADGLTDCAVVPLARFPALTTSARLAWR